MIIKNDDEIIDTYLTDASNFKGSARILMIPENIDEIHQALKYCRENQLPITISAGRTGLTGGSVPLSGAVISLEKLNKIIKIDIGNSSAVLEPGVVIADFQEELRNLGFFYPPNPTEQNSNIGGNISTNASGARTFKYGATRNFVKRLKILLADGDVIEIKRGEQFVKNGHLTYLTNSGKIIELQILDIKMPPIKHAAGYYLKEDMDAIDIFIGSEGTLGIFIEIEVEINKLPEKVLGGLIFFDNEDNMLEFVNVIREKSLKNNLLNTVENNHLSARLIEFFDEKSLLLLKSKFNDIPDNPVSGIWFEQEYCANYEDEVLTHWYNLINKYTSLGNDSWMALNDSDHKRLSEFRHELPLQVFELITKFNSIKFGTDTAVPSHHMKEYHYFLKNILETSGLTYFTWGHIGNTHYHANILSKTEEETVKAKELYKLIIDKALELGGTVSAEHGIGKLKKVYLIKMFGNEIVEYMKSIKLKFDEKSIINRNNLFD
jgi:D-lactate dehydrogenase (cytochrome)